MSRDKQIEEMAKDLCDIDCKGMKCDVCDSYGCEYRIQAEALYNAGYRKSTDVAEEIFAEIREQLVEYFNGKDKEYTTMRTKSTKQFQIATAHYQGATNAIVFALNALAELKKKYTEEGK